MSKKEDQISYREVIKIVSEMRVELLNEVKGLREDFRTLEEGRLTRLENRVTSTEARIFTATTIIAFLISVAISIAGFFVKGGQ